ncbi:hypothetical protein HDU97_000619 [Phlyctochytrium planicorne]|nr:hypothetical protein HDU97_000619 [Phlyctochytrium planicorne]
MWNTPFPSPDETYRPHHLRSRPHAAFPSEKENMRFRGYAFIGGAIISIITYGALIHNDDEPVPASTNFPSSIFINSFLPNSALLPGEPKKEEELGAVSERIVSSAGKGSPTIVSELQMDQVKESRNDLAVWLWGKGGGWSPAALMLKDDKENGKVENGNGNDLYRIKELDGTPFRDVSATSVGIALVDHSGNLHHIDLRSHSSKSPPTAKPVLKGWNFTGVAYAQPESTSLINSKSKSLSKNSQTISPLPPMFALTANGSIYRINASNETNAQGSPGWRGWFFPSSHPSIRPVSTSSSGLFSSPRFKSVVAGKNHIVALSSSGKVFTAAIESSDELNINAQGELGLPSQKLNDLKDGKLRPVEGLDGNRVVQIAAGDAFCLARTDDGRVFAWGANSFGQLGTSYPKDIPNSNRPLEVKTIWARSKASIRPSDAKCCNIVASGNTAFFVVDRAEKTEVLSCGLGLWGQLGQGGFSHLQNTPSPLPAISNLTEYSERLKATAPIRIASLALSPTHGIAILHSSHSATFGRDALSWGLNDRGQLRRADGKRGNTGVPVWMAPVRTGEKGDGVKEIVEAMRHHAHKEGSAVAEGNGRLQVAGPGWGKAGSGWWRKVKVEEAFACGDGITILYPRVVRT